MLIQRMMLGSRVQDKTTWDLGYTIADDAASKQIYVPLWNTDYTDTDKKWDSAVLGNGHAQWACYSYQ